MRFIDTHCHLDLSKNRNSFSKEINNNKIYTIAVTNLPKLFQKNKVILPETQYIKHALGYHPELVSQFPDQLGEFKQLIEKTRYIGEIGMDGSVKHKKSFIKQAEIFEEILSLCDKHRDKILTIHSRRAEMEVISLISKYPYSKKILHWYSGNLDEAEKAVALNCYFSFNHKMLSSKNGKNLLAMIPKERILLETDFPFGYSDETNFSNEYFEKLVEKTAQLKSYTRKDMLDIIEKNQTSILEREYST
ncbi:TPA: hydrolase [Enterococcus faecalis]|uniref:Qat anti-phage system TatD family nuclease QatD n=1 Tax=Enterococcus TaxID=1350 RepID=UPI0001B2BD10|nr:MULTISPECIES: Qat anti-phage system TatD family nuclease QatD [Enterococcus]HAP3747431.1 hydrolase [Enterococcus faecalis TDR28]HAP3753279.1 hydrolase [Enterococcus faecalis TDR22]HAP3756262.1 hydrolase [Enterococcus faecalis TDR13]HAP3759286.1 hydrolase [Enterococcus faecalis TDR7]HAP3770440.1 hydrolase [Enterococcus faecalis TDR19]